MKRWLVLLLALSHFALTNAVFAEEKVTVADGGSLEAVEDQDKPQRPLVVTSNPPLALLVKEVTGDLVEVKSLLQGNESPHHFQLRPKHLQMIADATMVVWIGPGFEPYLEKPLEKVSLHLPLSKAYRKENLHMWLDPDYVPVMVALVTDRLRRAVATHSVDFRIKFDAFYKTWLEKNDTWSAELASLKSAGFVADHDNWQHFFEFYKLDAPFYLQDHHGHAPGAQRRVALQSWLEGQQTACLLLEPGQSDALAGQLGSELKVVKVDPYSGAGATGFIDLYQGLVDSIKECKK